MKTTMIQTLHDYIKTLIGVRQPFCMVDRRVSLEPHPNWPTTDDGIRTGSIYVYRNRYGESKPWDMDGVTPILTISNLPVSGAACEVTFEEPGRTRWLTWYDLTELDIVKERIADILERETIQDVIWYSRREDGALIYQHKFSDRSDIPAHLWSNPTLQEYPRVLITQ